MRRRVGRAAAVLALHAALVVWLTWPLAAHLTTHLPDTSLSCHFDTLAVTWALAHESRALVTAPLHLGDGNIYHPARHALFYAEAGFGAVPYFAPTFLLSGDPALAANLMFLACVVLTAASLHLVVWSWTGSHLGGAIAGWTFLTSRWVLWTWVPTAPNYAVLQYFPWIVFLAASSAAVGLPRLLALVVLQGLTSVYVAPAVLGPLALLAAGRLARPATRRAGARLLGVVVCATLLLLGAYSGYLLVRLENPALAQQTLWTVPSVAVARPGALQQVLSHCLAALGVPVAALALIAAGAALFAWRARHARARQTPAAWAHGGLWTLAGIFISLGPVISLGGWRITLPQGWLAKGLPVYRILRDPLRLAVAALVGLALLAGVAFAECASCLPDTVAAAGRWRWLAALPRFVLATLLAAAMYASYSSGMGVGVDVSSPPLPEAYPLMAAITPDSPIMRALREPGGPLLKLPVAPSAIYHAQAEYASIFHGRPLLNGYSSYWPAAFPERMALACTLPDPTALARLRQETGLSMILVHTRNFVAWRPAPNDPYHCPPGNGLLRALAWQALAAQGGRGDLRLLARDGPDLLFAVADGGVSER